MRLDHLLSRERAEVERRKRIPRSIEEVSKSVIWETLPMLQPSKAQSECERDLGNGDRRGSKTSKKLSEHAKRGKRLRKAGAASKLFSNARNSVSFSRFGPNRTLTTAQQERFKRGQLRSPGRVMVERKLVSGAHDEKIKLLRAQGGCPGTIRRRRTWQAAKSYGEPQAGTDP